MNINDLKQMIDSENLTVENARIIIELAYKKGQQSIQYKRPIEAEEERITELVKIFEAWQQSGKDYVTKFEFRPMAIEVLNTVIKPIVKEATSGNSYLLANIDDGNIEHFQGGPDLTYDKPCIEHFKE